MHLYALNNLRPVQGLVVSICEFCQSLNCPVFGQFEIGFIVIVVPYPFIVFIVVISHVSPLFSQCHKDTCTGELRGDAAEISTQRKQYIGSDNTIIIKRSRMG